MTLALASRLKDFNRIEIISLAFYALSGLILLISLPFADYAPQLGLLGILSLIVAYGVFTKRGWAPWLIFVLFIAASTFCTLYAGHSRIQQHIGWPKYDRLPGAHVVIRYLSTADKKKTLKLQFFETIKFCLQHTFDLGARTIMIQAFYFWCGCEARTFLKCWREYRT